MKRYIVPVILLLASLGQSCSNWLDIKPSDRVTEENAFSSLQGFKQALNGIYVELNQNALYGRSLSCEFIEILAQRYDINQEAVGNYDLQHFDYGGVEVKGKIEKIWATAYNLIANTNLILKNCEQRREILPDDYYKLIKGETMALRAMLHFDLFRLFGPVYDKESSAESIPYYTEFSLEVNPRLPSEEFLGRVIQDLEEAASLLEDDPIITFGPNGDASDVFKSYRMLRLNYYAVQGLLARVYLYAEENAKALSAAQKVIDVQEKWFPWVKAENVTKDKIFSTEVLFALQNLNRDALFNALFNGEVLNIKEILIPREDVLLSAFDDNEYDFRFMSSFQRSATYGGSTYRIFSKYTGKDSLMYQMIPMLRVSEMYYIAAETVVDQDSALMYIEKVREHRGVEVDYEWDESDWEDGFLLTYEYYREFIGEGQLFYYYKRKKKTEMYNAGSVEKLMIEVDESSYVLPVPDGEIKYN